MCLGLWHVFSATGLTNSPCIHLFPKTLIDRGAKKKFATIDQKLIPIGSDRWGPCGGKCVPYRASTFLAVSILILDEIT